MVELRRQALCTRGHPGAYGGYYTKEEIRRIVAYAAERFIEVIPEIEFPGHSDEVFAAYPELCCSGRAYTSGEFCVGNPLSLKFMDDGPDRGSGVVPRNTSISAATRPTGQLGRAVPDAGIWPGSWAEYQVQCYLVEHAEKFLAEHGRTMIGWDEILKNNLRSTSTVISYRGSEEASRRPTAVTMWSCRRARSSISTGIRPILIHSRARWAVSRRFGRCTVFIPSPIPLQRRPTMNR